MSKITVDFKNECGRVKEMHSVNNGPVGSKVRGGNSTYKYFEEAGIPYARTHDASFYSGYGGEYTVDVHAIFRNFDADENDPASYDFEVTDTYLQNIESVGTKTFYRLGSKIEHGKKYGTYPPKDFKKWAVICEHIIRHYTEGWANGFKMDIEYWEIWNEPDCVNRDGSNPCWQGTNEQFAEFFTIVLKHLKTCFPHLKIGGPALCSIWSEDAKELNPLLLTKLREENLPLDFYSFHGYKYEPYQYIDDINLVIKTLEEYGYENTELILNEWNYVRGWADELWTYTLKNEQGIKGSSFIAGTMCVGQASRVDQLMYYDARPCGMNGMFHSVFLTPFKGYYPFKMFGELYRMGTSVKSESEEQDIYCTAAKGDNTAGIMVTYYDDNDDCVPKEIEVGCENLEKGKEYLIEYFLLDEDNDMKIVRSEKICNDNFKAYLNMNLYTTYFIEINQI